MSEDKAIENIINLSIDSNQSKNFFSRLHQQQTQTQNNQSSTTTVIPQSSETSPVVVETETSEPIIETSPVVVETETSEPIIETSPVVEAETSEPIIETSPVIEAAPIVSETEPSPDTINFLNKINSSQKIIGHNKFQQKIEDLERELDIYKKYNTEQDMKINLFKKTISNLQTQLQEKSNQINSNQNTETIIYTEQINTLTSNLSLKSQENVKLLERLHLLEMEIEYKNADFEKIKNEYILTLDKMSDLKQLYSSLDSNYQSQVNDIQRNKNIIKELENKLNLEATIKNKLETELSLLKTEVSEYRNNINNIKLEKDNEISLLIEKIHNMTTSSQPKEIILEEENIVKKEKTSIIGRSRRGSIPVRTRRSSGV